MSINKTKVFTDLKKIDREHLVSAVKDGDESINLLTNLRAQLTQLGSKVNMGQVKMAHVALANFYRNLAENAPVLHKGRARDVAKVLINDFSAAIDKLSVVTGQYRLDLAALDKKAKDTPAAHANDTLDQINQTGADFMFPGGPSIENFREALSKAVFELDVDTTRFMEWVWARRVHYGLSTGNAVMQIPGTNDSPIQVLMSVFENEKLVLEFKSENVWRAVVEDPEHPGAPKFVVFVTHYLKSDPYAVLLLGDVDMVSAYESELKERFTLPQSKMVQTLSNITDQGQMVTRTDVIAEGTSRIGHDAFYPFIEGGLAKLAKDFEESDEAVLIFLGAPGLGKTTAMRSLMLMMDREKFGVCNSALALEHPAISQWIGSFGDNAVVAFEDADSFIKTREQKNYQMSMLLNESEGIVQSKRKLIFSTNLPSDRDIDAALMRPGRCFQVVHFRDLLVSDGEPNAARAAIGRPPLEFESANVTLSEALNGVVKKRSRHKTGF